ncbi:hypothetical protein ATE68_01010 [Sphingopyxis sp. H038]|uniref:hypothetical protein n=1 Tax=unclassified Sphingopyxis TaxID=2614943 RepID=UPI0007371ABC|nr:MULTISPECIES: hypothetical protein [unclassified Sphingopyxis]KTE04265.1 hypothetical protein ATE78_01010 [Sphingopyxis sp. H012]KTE10894.1 hypothetical protein ATE76_13330 [Sphingopyxis sp. H093]KTE13534.1 hypothetical protein ATE70_02415 [Sphingopyxis sp. H053]KTE25606.1 hypothetical protein ATE75_15965 [Sphingopyxis sp. H080]KTE36754.1 hypothetical protein ATE68_01010 [Sphingopyxis sp. H038]
MQPVLRAAVAVTALLATANVAQAQGLLKRLADRAVEKVEQAAEKIADDAINGSARPREEAGVDEEAPAPRQDAPAATPASVNPPLPATKARYIDSLKTPPDIETKKAEYDKFGEVSCNACEGGVELDGRPTFPFDEFSGKYNERAKRAGSWPVGYTHRWQGKGSAGTLTVTSEERVEGFRCRRLEYRLERGGASANRPGLICFGLANRSSEVENWHEIY